MVKQAYLLAARAIRPLMGIPFPSRWRAFALLANNKRVNSFWHDQPLIWTKSKTTGFEVPCDMSVFSGRIAWFFRRWYEIETESVLRTLLKNGGNFVDVGGNVGMASLVAYSAIGSSGKILAFEPNPKVAAIYRATMDRNGISNYSLVEAAVGGERKTTEMFVPKENHGEAHVGSDCSGRAGEAISIAMTDGSELDQLSSVDLIKIDVEGFELTVLKALQEYIARDHPPIVCEVISDRLWQAGVTTGQLLAFFGSIGYLGFEIALEDVSLTRQRAKLLPLAEKNGAFSCNALFVHGRDVGDILSRTYEDLPR